MLFAGNSRPFSPCFAARSCHLPSDLVRSEHSSWGVFEMRHMVADLFFFPFAQFSCFLALSAKRSMSPQLPTGTTRSRRLPYSPHSSSFFIENDDQRAFLARRDVAKALRMTPLQLYILMPKQCLVQHELYRAARVEQLDFLVTIGTY